MRSNKFSYGLKLTVVLLGGLVVLILLALLAITVPTRAKESIPPAASAPAPASLPLCQLYETCGRIAPAEVITATKPVEPVETVAPVETVEPVETVTPVEPVEPANLAGGIPVLEYHLFAEPEDRWQRTPANFRADLERLLAAGYYPVNLRDLAAGNLGMVPAGRRPVVLTFDDSSIGQFNLLPDGSVDPDSAVGIMLAFHQQHPADWPLLGTFFVLQDVDAPDRILFGQPEWAQQKLQMLVNWGMEVGSHTISHADLSASSAEEVQRQLGVSQQQLAALLPGYAVTSLSVPFGSYPAEEWLLAEGSYNGVPYRYTAVVEVAGGLTASPYAAEFDPFHILRVQATQEELDYWLAYADEPGVSYVSAGE